MQKFSSHNKKCSNLHPHIIHSGSRLYPQVTSDYIFLMTDNSGKTDIFSTVSHSAVIQQVSAAIDKPMQCITWTHFTITSTVQYTEVGGQCDKLSMIIRQSLVTLAKGRGEIFLKLTEFGKSCRGLPSICCYFLRQSNFLKTQRRIGQGKPPFQRKAGTVQPFQHNTSFWWTDRWTQGHTVASWR